jgi:hypothetical protein
MTTRYLPLLLLTGACVAESDSPTLSVTVNEDNTASIHLVRGANHVFDDVSASANGIDCGSPMITPGSTHFGTGRMDPATAKFTIDLAKLGASADIVVVDDGERFEVVAPTLGAPRSAQIVSPLTAPLVSGAVIESTTGVAGDRLYGDLVLKQGQAECMVGVPAESPTPSLSLPMPTDLASAWKCGTVTPGSLVQASLALGLSVRPAVARCDGNNLTCSVDAKALIATAPVLVQF